MSLTGAALVRALNYFAAGSGLVSLPEGLQAVKPQQVASKLPPIYHSTLSADRAASYWGERKHVASSPCEPIFPKC